MARHNSVPGAARRPHEETHLAMSPARSGLDSAQTQLLSQIGLALDAGRVDEAARLLPPLLQSHPDHPEVRRMQAGLLGMQGQLQPAIALMHEVIRRHPGHAPGLNTLATLLGQAGDFDSAIHLLREVCRLQPEMALAWYNLGVMLTRCVRNEDATEALQQAVRLDPRAVDARALLADLLRMRGQSEEAASIYRQVLAERPWAGMAWWGLADLKTVQMQESDIRSLQQALRAPRASDDDRIAMGFALAREHWGRRYAREALTVLLDHAFGRIGLRRIEADVDARNQGSLNTLEALGFRREGYLRQRWLVAGELQDSVLMGLLASEWTQPA